HWTKIFGETIPEFTTAEYRLNQKLQDVDSITADMPVSKKDWLQTENGACEFEDGLRLMPIVSRGILTDFYLLESGLNWWGLDRLAGQKPELQKIVDSDWV